MFALEQYLQRPRTFKGPLADHVARRVDFVNYINNEVSYVAGLDDFGPIEEVETDTLV